MIEPKFQSLGRLHNGLAPAGFGGQFGFIDRTGAFVIQPKFDRVTYFENDQLSIASIDKKWGLIDRSGAWAIEPQYSAILRTPGKTIFWVLIGEKFGAIDRSGKLIVAPRFSQFGGQICDDGWAIGFDNRKQRAVPREGMQLVAPDGELFGSNCKDPLQLEVNGKFGLVDRMLKPLTEVKFDRIDSFWNGSAVAKVDGKFGFLNSDGSWLIEPRFDDAGNFVGDYAIAGLNGKFGCLRRSGAWAIEPQFEDKNFGCEIAVRLANAKPDRPDPDGKLTIDPRIQNVGLLFYLVKLEGKFGVVNDAGDWVIEPRWRSLSRFFGGGLVAAKFDDKWGFIDASGAQIIEDKYEASGGFLRGVAWIQSGGSWCAIDRRGQRVPSLPCQEVNPNPPPGTVTFQMRG